MLGLLVLIRTFLSFSLEMIGIPFCGSAHRDPKNPAGDHIPASVWEPKTASMRSRLAKEPHFDQTVFDNSLLCQSEVGFQAELDVASIWERVRVFTLTGYPSIFLGRVESDLFFRGTSIRRGRGFLPQTEV